MSRVRPAGGPLPPERVTGAATSVVELYGRPGCCLCDDARAVLEGLRDELGFALVELDIAADDAAHRAYFERIPVVRLNGVELFDFHVDEAVLREALASPGMI